MGIAAFYKSEMIDFRLLLGHFRASKLAPLVKRDLHSNELLECI